MYKVTFVSYAKSLNKWFENVEMHKSIADARLRACALNWQIKSIVEVAE